MNITREIIADLWQVYTAGEASADTRALVEEFIKHDPEFAGQLKEGTAKGLPRLAASGLPPDRQAETPGRKRLLLDGTTWLLFLAMLFSGFAFGRIISDTSWDVSPMNFTVIAVIAAGFWVAFIIRIVRMQGKGH